MVWGTGTVWIRVVELSTVTRTLVIRIGPLYPEPCGDGRLSIRVGGDVRSISFYNLCYYGIYISINPLR
jgi:hypothetical protein